MSHDSLIHDVQRTDAATPARAFSRPLRVLHCMSTNFGMTGVETFILQLCAAQSRSGHVPGVTLELARREEVAAGAAAMGVPVFDFPQRTSLEEALPRKLGTAILRARRIHALAALLRDSDILHLHSVGLAGLDALIAAMLARIPVVVTHHTTVAYSKPVRNRTSDAMFWLEKKIAARAVMPYADAAAELVNHGMPPDRVSIIPFCVDEALFTGRVTPPARGELRLVMAARMFDGKGHEDLLQAIASLRPRFPKLSLVFIGDGPMRPQIEAMIKRLELESVVELMGRVSHDEMPGILTNSHVVVLPSYMQGETFPICLLEGMALGLPAIGSRWFGIPDIISNGETGFLVDPKDARGLANAIEQFLLMPDLYASSSRKARERVLANFTATVVAKAYTQVYEDALQPR